MAKGWAAGMLGTLTTGFGILSGGAVYGFIGSASGTAIVTNITAKAVVGYAMYSTAAANVGAFIIELANPDPNGTPGLEFTQGDEVARGLKLIFKQTAVPLVRPIEKSDMNLTDFRLTATLHCFYKYCLYALQFYLTATLLKQYIPCETRLHHKLFLLLTNIHTHPTVAACH
jgi:hypothetical protein